MVQVTSRQAREGSWTRRRMEMRCNEVIRELSRYIDQDVEPELRREMEEHIAKCTHCTAILDGTRNVIQLICDNRTFEVPTGFSQRLRERISRETSHSKQ
ncbi:MAG: hypothetical protein DMG85_12770 [Acidobacteria bacterium]|nr:MAG: hypothetical protein DMG85_12770 [Acidobacteriota bacterium]